ncbi:MAG: zinc-binding dehydrogenase [Myxococcota bacterium]
MKAWILPTTGGPEAFELIDMPRPKPEPGRVLIRVHAFGLNRSEWFTRIGDSPTVELPRVLGIECAGTVEASPGGEFEPGQKVFAMMGGMGREYDGSYAEYTSVPVSSVFAIDSSLEWDVLGALPEMLQTTHGSLRTGLGVKSGGGTILVRGGTSSIGLMTAVLAKNMGLRVATTTRNPAKRDALLASSADEVFVDEGTIAEAVRQAHPEGVDYVLELIGTTTLLDSLQCAAVGGVVCMTGILGGRWEIDRFRPMEHIPMGVRLSAYGGGAEDITREDLQRYVGLVESGDLEVQRGPVWEFTQLVEAHQAMDENRANGKMVVVV